jgi:hypothetical protein
LRDDGERIATDSVIVASSTDAGAEDQSGCRMELIANIVELANEGVLRRQDERTIDVAAAHDTE